MYKIMKMKDVPLGTTYTHNDVTVSTRFNLDGKPAYSLEGDPYSIFIAPDNGNYFVNVPYKILPKPKMISPGLYVIKHVTFRHQNGNYVISEQHGEITETRSCCYIDNNRIYHIVTEDGASLASMKWEDANILEFKLI